MQPDPYIAALRRVFAENTLPNLLAAHRQDPLIWKTLQDPDVFQKMLSLAGDQVSRWTPASISLLALDLPVAAESLQALPLIALEPEIRQQAAALYEDTFRNLVPPATLAEASLLALALRERRRLTDSWQGLLSELQINPAATHAVQLRVWRTSLACLFGMIPDPGNLLQALAPRPGSPIQADQVGLVVQPMLANPLSLEDQAALLAPVLTRYTTPDQLLWLQTLRALGREDLARLLARELVQSHSKVTASKAMDPFALSFEDPVLASENLHALLSRRQLAAYHLAAENPGAAVPLLSDVWSGVRRFQSHIAAQFALASRAAGDMAAALDAQHQAVMLDPQSIQTRLDLALGLADAGRMEDAWAALPENDSDPEISLVRSILAEQSGERAKAQEFALQAVQLVGEVQAKTLLTAPQIWLDPGRACHALLAADLSREAGELASSILISRPCDPEALRMLAAATQRAGAVEDAAHLAQMAVLLQPANLILRREYADLLERSEDWLSALQERTRINAMNSHSETADLLAVARCAVSARQTEQAVRACQAVLASDPENGLACIYLGEACRIDRDSAGALRNFTQATLLTPEEPAGWLALSRMQKETGDPYKGLETLRAGAHAAPQSADLQYALAEEYLASGSPSEALPALRRANFLAPESPMISIRLGEILRDLGHLDESRQVLERARKACPTHPNLAYAHSKTLLAQGQTDAAIPALQTALEAQPQDPEPYLIYARLILGDRSAGSLKSSKRVDGKSLQGVLAKALRIEPGNIEGRILLAEALTASGQFAEALALYTDLTDAHLIADPTWNWRIRLGMGSAALSDGQLETALAALQEAAALQPGSLIIQQTLAEALRQANLVQEALEAARVAIHLAPLDLDNLAWFTRIAYTLDAHSESITALERAVELNPVDPDNTLLLVRLQIQENNSVAARETLQTMLELESLGVEALWRAARCWLALDDLSAGLACLERACTQPEEQTAGLPDMWLELAILRARTGSPDKALIAIERAVLANPEDSRLPYFQADVLVGMDRGQAAMACLEDALRLAEMFSDQKPAPSSLAQDTLAPLPVPPYLIIHAAPARIHQRIARLMRRSGDVAGALTHAECALAAEPESLDGRCLAADLSFAMLDITGAYQFLSTIGSAENKTFSESFDLQDEAQRQLAVNLLCLRAELELETDNLPSAAETARIGTDLFPNSARLLAVQARVEAAAGEIQKAGAAWEKAVNLLGSQANSGKHASAWPFYPNSITVDGVITAPLGGDELVDYPTLTLAEASLDLCQWDAALALFDQAARSAPMEARAHFSLARGLVRCAEAQRILSEVHAFTHAPGEEKSGLTYQQMFEKSISAAQRQSGSPIVSRWQKRGQAVFQPNSKTVRQLASMPANSSDTAVLIGACRLIGDAITATEAASRFPEDPAVLAELALLQHITSPEEAYFTARALLAGQPVHPAHLALFAMFALEAGDFSSGQAAIEAALEIWPAEAEWHLLASGLCEHAQDWNQAIVHAEQAFQLDPENARSALALGQSHLKAGHAAESLQVLEQAVRLDPNLTDAWSAMARAYSTGGDPLRAIASAEKAVSLAPGQVAPLLLCGEIALLAGQIDLVHQHAESALQLDPANPHALLLLVRSLAIEGEPAEALEALEQFLPSASDPYPLKIERVALIRQAQGMPAALLTLQELVLEYPDDPVILGQLAEALAATGQRVDAERTAQAALQIRPDQPEMHLLVGRIQRVTGQLDQAIFHLTEAVRQAPEHMEAHLELGRAYTERREHAQALQVYKKAIQITRTDPRPFYQAGLALKESKDYVGAEGMLRRAADYAPEDVNIRRQLGAIIALNLVHNPQEA